MKLKSLLAGSIVSLVLASGTHAAGEVNVYSYRQQELIQPMIDAFSARHDIDVNVIFAKKGMLEKLMSEGANSPADVLFTVDIGRLSDLKNAGLTQPANSAVLDQNIPSQMRDADSHWFGLTSRARIIVASRDRVEKGAVTSYEQLADSRFKGLICTRSGKHPYMVALTASMISVHGEVEAEKWLAGVRDNLARKPQSNDRGQVKAIKEGECDIAVINHYYLALMLANPEQKPAADSIYVIFPNQEDRGTHMNISGMAMARHAPNRDNALKLMEFLASDAAQQMYAELNGEYPVKNGIPLSSDVRQWGDFKRDSLDLDEVAKHRAEASKMADRVNYDG